jgi:long-chain acyl-CoA synthetase
MMLSVCLALSCPIVLVNHDFTLDTLYKAAAKYRVTHYEGGASVIVLMEKMAGRPIPYDISTLTSFGFGGSKVPGSVVENVLRAYPGIGLYQGYGSTETSALITKTSVFIPVKPGSVGTAITNVEVAIETDDGITSAPLVEGEIVVGGPNVMLGYLGDEAATKRALGNGYLHTGDIGYLDEDGYLFISGRKKTMIIVRGFKVYPEEVEACIVGSALVKECLVYGQADALGNEIICADIVPARPGVKAEDIKSYCASHLAEYKRPHRITVCESIRKNASGKIDRRKEDSPCA